MGLDANYPAVTMNDPNGHVTVYNQDHLPIGQLGPTPFESPSVNVTCKRKAWDDADWYRLLNPEGWPFPADEAYGDTGVPSESIQPSSCGPSREKGLAQSAAEVSSIIPACAAYMTWAACRPDPSSGSSTTTSSGKSASMR